MITIIRKTDITHPSLHRKYQFRNSSLGTKVLNHHQVFFSGDMNYRIDLDRDEAVLNKEDFRFMNENDQLNKLRTDPLFPLAYFEEATIQFQPTYKYDPGSSVFDSSEKKRIPAYCDRILFSSSKEYYVENVYYKSHPECNVSDHKPISGYYKTQISTVDENRYNQLLNELNVIQTSLLKDIISYHTELYLLFSLGYSKRVVRPLLDSIPHNNQLVYKDVVSISRMLWTNFMGNKE